MASRLCFNIGFLIVALVGLLSHGANAANTYIVGGDFGWIVPPNNSYYEEWASRRTFQIGDSLVFNWTTGSHSAIEVASREEYDNCTIPATYLLINPGDIVAFNENGTRYFLCSEGSHCKQGQKMIIKIGDGKSSSPPKDHAALSAVLSTTTIFAATLIHLCSFFLY